MVRTLRPARKLKGSIRLPGDKSISHRYGMLSAIAEGESVIRNYSTGADCAATLECMRRLGAQVEHDDVVRVQGVGLDGLQAPGAPLDAGNSGSTIRMLSGILAGQPFETEIAGDDSLTRRPMGRIITPLELMGAKIRAREGNFPPPENQWRIASGHRVRTAGRERAGQIGDPLRGAIRRGGDRRPRAAHHARPLRDRT